MTDFKFACRQLRRSPGFAVTVVLTLALAIGANTAIFSMLNALLLKQLPYAQPDRMGTIYVHVTGAKGSSDDDGRQRLTGEMWENLRDQVPSLISAVYLPPDVGSTMQAGSAAGLAVPMSFLKFSRDAEREADLLGIEYEYKAGYDPTSFVNFFEKLKAQEKQKKNFIAKAFSTHPMTADRVERAQSEISEYLPSRPQYIVDTSEFEQIKARLASVLNQRSLLKKKSDQPTLHRVEHDPDTGEKGHGGSDDDGRPTLKRPAQP